jgi:hypothetical protein
VIFYDGQLMDVAGLVEPSAILSHPILGKETTLTMSTRLNADGSWQMACAPSGSPAATVVRDITSHLKTGPPIGIAIATYTAAAEFDRVRVCP